ncbi:MAG: hypothetical protein OEM96_07425, partial [Gemmatimonadota bacterium]|nr:hypothetical protein [Gemmatimonadota bacterium]
MPLPILILCTLGLGTALSLPVDTIPQLVQTELSLELRVDYEARTVGGTATLVLRNVGQDPIPVLPLQVGRL